MEVPIRILHVYGKLNRGGAETMIMNIYRNIDRSKVQFDFIIHSEEECDYSQEIRDLGGRIYSIQRYNGKNHFKYKREWNNFFKNHPEYKIVHGHVRSTAAIYLNIAKKYGISTIAHSHSTSSGKGSVAFIKNILQFPIRYKADYFFACSNRAGQWLFGRNICEQSNFYIIKNAIDTSKYIFNESIRIKKRKEFNLEDKFVIGHIGRFDYPKNHNFIIDIFYEVYKKNKNSILILIGDGELRRKIEDKVISLGLSKNVIFTGVRTDINEILQAMDVFIFPSIYEGLGLAVIEAQASGLPCIVSEALPKEETNISEYIKYLRIDKSSYEWSEQILNLKYKRENMYEHLKLSGYDINDTSKFIEKFYIDLI